MSEPLKSFIIWHVFWSISLTFSFTLSVSNGFSGCYAICRQKIGQITPVEEFAVVVLFWFLSRLHPIAIYSYCILAIPIENARKNVYYMSVTYLKCFDITMSTHTHKDMCVLLCNWLQIDTYLRFLMKVVYIQMHMQDWSQNLFGEVLSRSIIVAVSFVVRWMYICVAKPSIISKETEDAQNYWKREVLLGEEKGCNSAK